MIGIMFSLLNMFLILLGLLFFLFGLYKLFKVLETEHEFVENYLYTYLSLALSVVIISYVLSQVVFALALVVLILLFAVTYVPSHDTLPLKGPVFNIGYRELLGSGFMGMLSFVVMLWGLFFMMAYGIAIYTLAMHSVMTSLVLSMLLAIVVGVSIYMLYGNRYYVDLEQTTSIRKDIGQIVSNDRIGRATIKRRARSKSQMKVSTKPTKSKKPKKTKKSKAKKTTKNSSKRSKKRLSSKKSVKRKKLATKPKSKRRRK